MSNLKKKSFVRSQQGVNICYLIVPLILRIELLHVFEPAQQALQLVDGPARADLVGLLHVAAAVHGVLRVGSTSRAAVQTISIGRRLSVAEVA